MQYHLTPDHLRALLAIMRDPLPNPTGGETALAYHARLGRLLEEREEMIVRQMFGNESSEGQINLFEDEQA